MSKRREFLRSGVLVGIVGFSGCSGFISSNDTPTPANKDTDGDGVINSEDYAPRDASVQRAEQVKEVDSSTTQQTPPESPTPTDSPTPTSTPPQSQLLASFERGWDGFDVLIGDGVSYNQGDDAHAERTRDKAHTGDWSVRVECSKNGNDGDVAVRRTGIDVEGWNSLQIWCKLVVGNTYGNTFLQLYNESGNRIKNYVVRDEQEQGVWEQPTFDISGLSTLRIDLVAASGAAAPQEILVDHITLGRQLG